jgi:hypothetical protein
MTYARGMPYARGADFFLWPGHRPVSNPNTHVGAHARARTRDPVPRSGHRRARGLCAQNFRLNIHTSPKHPHQYARGAHTHRTRGPRARTRGPRAQNFLSHHPTPIRA